ncbi:hypothetical protein PF005_g33311 [Phytophthora fragariae]|uniref:Uncharacterized protein n=1 Tax=Phytophthora fragariae TaxID=53985 RepID=A0A6A3PMX3_9STRA|nr:hypothetical protein PF003_g18015 [Phytophthora fragariae]KAE8932555.1 hypothetical protein PF009_g17428 [Phytophthora fragariae]KAE8952268.1 hypothetical protein PF011_g32748 [Phytophthora fragariae]KAE9053470.1 hypothetical protein PF010_g32896 [Phytophthora fragariae]KAE9054035.1 hypothetical protein PF007_g32756 [Phytophthora fragariae]
MICSFTCTYAVLVWYPSSSVTASQLLLTAVHSSVVHAADPSLQLGQLVHRYSSSSVSASRITLAGSSMFGCS